MTQLFITLGLITFIVVTHILVYKWIAYFHEKYAADPKKQKNAVVAVFMSVVILFGLAAFVLIQTSS